MFHRSIVKLVALESAPRFPAASCARTLTRAAVPAVFGTVQAWEPELAMPLAIALGKVAPPFVEYARSTLVTPTLSVADQVMECDAPAFQSSPPTGEVTTTAGGVLSATVLTSVNESISAPLALLMACSRSTPPSMATLQKWFSIAETNTFG